MPCNSLTNGFIKTISGVESFDIDIKEQKVTVKGNVEPEAVFQTVSKTGKKTSYWPAEAEAATESKTEAETKTEAKVDATADVEPKLAEAETKPSQV